MSPEYTTAIGKDGRTRLKIAGERMFPFVMKEGESGDDAVARYFEGKREREAAKATAPPASAGYDDALKKVLGEAEKAGAKPRGSDPKPRVRARAQAAKRASDDELRKMLEEMLVMPAIPMSLPVHDPHLDHRDIDGRLIPGSRPRCAYCAQHFLTEGPKTAEQLVKIAANNEPLRRLLERVHVAYASITLAGALAGYAAKPILHHLAPESVLAATGPVLGIPPRPPAVPRHRHNVKGNGAGPAAPAQSAGPA